MAKRNEGDIMEGIFSIGLADLFANGNVSKGRVNIVRAKIDTNIFSRGAFSYEYSSKEVPPDPDIVKINLQVRLKRGSTWEAYGPEWKMMYDRVGDIGNLDNKITQIINTLNTNYREKIITDKAPLNFRWIGLIKMIFPNSKIIHCERNGMDTCYSKISWKIKYEHNFCIKYHC